MVRKALPLLLGACLMACAAPDSPPEATGNLQPGKCPGGAQATWCLLFPNGATASIEVAGVVPNSNAVIRFAGTSLPLDGQLDVTTSSFRWTVGSVDSLASVEGHFPRASTMATGTIVFAEMSQDFTLFVPAAAPQSRSSPTDSVTGIWSRFPAHTTTPPAVSGDQEIAQLGRLLIWKHAFVAGGGLNGQSVTVPRFGWRKGLSFQFPNWSYVADGGSSYIGTFSTDLTMTTGTYCNGSIVGDICAPLVMVRR